MQPRRRLLGVIGTSGRKWSARRSLVGINLADWCHRVEAEASRVAPLTDTILVSGASAFADHVAVLSYIDPTMSWGGLILHLPCRFDLARRRFAPIPGHASSAAAATTLNELHTTFSRDMARNSLLDLYMAITWGARVVEHNGFDRRNTAIAESVDTLIAFSPAGKDGAPEAGSGTAQTWRRAATSCHKVCIPV
jgi:hypothetical protein